MDGMTAPMETETVKARASEILVAIPTLNEALHIETCIASLMVGDDRLSDVAFIVADGGSNDGTQSIVETLSSRYPNLRLVDNPARLQSAAVNTVAFNHAGDDTRYLIRCDAHSIYPPGFITGVADSLLRTGAQSIVVPMRAVGDSCFQKGNAWIVDTPLGSGGSAHRGLGASKYVDHGHHAGFDLETFVALEGYDESFSHNEDAEYDHRVGLSGGKVFMDAGLGIAYKPRPTFRALWQQYFKYGKGRARTIRKHGIRPKLRQLIPVANCIGLILSLLIAPALPLALAYPALYFGALATAAVAVAIVKRSACGMSAGPASFAMHNAWALGFIKQIWSR